MRKDIGLKDIKMEDIVKCKCCVQVFLIISISGKFYSVLQLI